MSIYDDIERYVAEISKLRGERNKAEADLLASRERERVLRELVRDAELILKLTYRETYYKPHCYAWLTRAREALKP